jgi:anti-sigma factor RsiW
MSGLTQPHRDAIASELLVHAYVDGELGPADALAVQRDIASNPGLAAEAQNAIVLSRRRCSANKSASRHANKTATSRRAS